jgi:drug/metabolite transporter (DMT)-like permease
MQSKTSPAVQAAAIRKRRLRRVAGVLLVLFGALLMWLAPESASGAVLLAAGVALEAVGLVLEHRAGRSGKDNHAVER